MNAKTVVGWLLGIGSFAIVNIILFGLVSDLFIVSYFVITAIVIYFILSFSKEYFTTKKEILILIFLGTLLCTSVTFYAFSLKSTLENSQGTISSASYQTQALQYQIDVLKNKNDYYIKYIDYQFKLLNAYRDEESSAKNELMTQILASSKVKDETIVQLSEALEIAKAQLESYQSISQEPVYIYVTQQAREENDD